MVQMVMNRFAAAISAIPDSSAIINSLNPDPVRRKNRLRKEFPVTYPHWRTKTGKSIWSTCDSSDDRKCGDRPAPYGPRWDFRWLAMARSLCLKWPAAVFPDCLTT